MAESTTNPVTAVAKAVQISPRKIKPVVALVRRRSVDDALVILEHTPRRSAKAVAKAIASAKANATNNHNYRADGLIISEIYVTHGQRFKRYRPAARGRALPYQKRTSHIHVTLDGNQKPAKKTSPKKSNPKEKK